MITTRQTSTSLVISGLHVWHLKSIWRKGLEMSLKVLFLIFKIFIHNIFIQDYPTYAHI